MKALAGYIHDYIRSTSAKSFMLITLLVSCMIWANYSWSLDRGITALSFFERSLLRYGLLLTAFLLPYVIINASQQQHYFRNKMFLILLLIAPMIFALKMSVKVPSFSFPGETGELWNHIIFWPSLLVLISLLLYLCQVVTKSDRFFGLSRSLHHLRPYLLLLLLMMPLVLIASVQADFTSTYPKLFHATGIDADTGLNWWKALLFELSYGSDFVTIEIFFRGFLVAGFLKWVGKDAILPMAAFYCTIHFGKPLAECISSYFGGIILGVIVYHTRSITGGLLVHLGIAWMMEAAGCLRHVI